MTGATKRLVQMNLENPHFREMVEVRRRLVEMGMQYTARMLVLEFVKAETPEECRRVIEKFDHREDVSA